MNLLIDRYVYDVIRRLPEQNRTDVERELKANISDMLPESPTASDVERVLNSLGDPGKLAEQYRVKPRYLISPSLFDDYLTILKLVISLLAVIFSVLSVFGTLVDAPAGGTFGQGLTSAFTGILSALFSAITNGFLWVTLSFGLAEYFQTAKGSHAWSIKDLPNLPSKNHIKISRAETVIGMVFSAVFLVIMVRYQSLIGWHEYGLNSISLPLFNSLAVNRYIPYLAGLTIISWAVAAVKFYYARWNYPIALLSGINSILWTAASILFLTGANTFNPAFIQRAANAFDIELQAMNSYWQNGITAFCILSLIGTAIEIVSGVFKAQKSRSLPN